jgi:hypothetical protein
MAARTFSGFVVQRKSPLPGICRPQQFNDEREFGRCATVWNGSEADVSAVGGECLLWSRKRTFRLVPPNFR